MAPEATPAFNEFTTPLSIEGWTYGSAPNHPVSEAKYGNPVIYTYASDADGEYTSVVPVDAGTWYVKATVIGTAEYAGIESVVPFVIQKADSFITVIGGQVKPYDGEALTVQTVDRLGDGAVSFTYYTDGGKPLIGVPVDKGSYYVKATVAESDNYRGFTTGFVSFEITARSITVSGVGAEDKTYDGTTSVVLDLASVEISGVLDGDDVSVSAIGLFSDANVGVGKTVRVGGYSLSGESASNYSVSNESQSSTFASILALVLTVSWDYESAFTYDGEVHAVTPILGGIIAADAGNVSPMTSDASAIRAGTYTAEVTGLSGTASGNYTLPVDVSLVWLITQKQLVVTGAAVADKTYDGTVAASVTKGILSGVVDGDEVELTADGAFPSSVVGMYTVVIAFTISGVSASDYLKPVDVNCEASIIVCSVEIPRIDAGFVYDGTLKTCALADPLYTVSGNSAVAAGTHHAVVSLGDKVNYEWSDHTVTDKLVAWAIAPHSIDAVDVTGVGVSYAFTGSPIEPLPLVTSTLAIGEVVLFKDVDYTVSYSDERTCAGSTVTVTVAGIGNYGGTVEKTFSITRIAVNKPASDPTQFTYDGTQKTYSVVTNDLYSVTGTTRTSAGSQEVRVALKDKTDYEWADHSTDDVVFTFTIGKTDYDISGVTFSNGTHVYDGQRHALLVSGVLPTGIDGVQVTVSYSGYAVNVSDGLVTVTAIFATESPNYNAPAPMQAKVSITAADLPDIQFLTDTVVYNGVSQEPIVTIPGCDLDRDFLLSWDVTGFINAGSYTATATGVGNYSGSRTAVFTISPYDLAGATVSGVSDSAYTGFEQTPVPVVTVHFTRGESVLDLVLDSEHYAVSYGDNLRVGTATVTVAAVPGSVNYAGSVSKSFDVIPADLDVTAFGFTGVYDGCGHTGSVIIESSDHSSVDLRFGTTSEDCELSVMPAYTDAGVYAVYYKATAENYADAVGSVTVTISPMLVTLTVVDVTSGVNYDGTAHSTAIVRTDMVGEDDVTYSLMYSGESDPPVNAGTYVVTIASAFVSHGNACNYALDISDTGVLVIAKFNMSGVTVTEITDQTYSGTSITPVPVVSVSSPMQISVGDYTVSYSGNVDAGTATLTLTADAASVNYSGVMNATFRILPRDVIVTPASGQSKTFEQGDPDLVYALGESVAVVGNLTRASGENVGTYAVALGTLHAESSNYRLVISPTPVVFTILPKVVTVTPSPGLSKVYGSADPVLTYSLSEEVSVAGALQRIAGEDVGSYPISLGTLVSLSGNHVLSMSVANVPFNITPAPLTVTVVGSTQTVDYNGTLRTVTGFTADNTDKATVFLADGKIASASGINAGTYTMGLTEDSFEVSSLNYDVTLSITDGRLVINKISPVAGDFTFVAPVDLVYDGSPKSPAVSVKNSVIGMGAVSVTSSGARTDVGSYTVYVSVSEGGNYLAADGIPVGTFDVTKRALTVTVTGNRGSFVFDNTGKTVTGFTADNTDKAVVTLAEGRTASVSRVTVGSSSMGLTTEHFEVSSLNYDVTLSVVDGYVQVTKRPISITADSISCVYGSEVPAYSATVGNLPDGVEWDDYRLSCPYVRGFPIGVYTISVTGNPHYDYEITYVSGSLTVTNSVTLSADGYDAPYDGLEHGSITSLNVYVNGSETYDYDVQFSINEVDWSPVLPVVSDVAQTRVFIRASVDGGGTGFASVTANVSHRTVTVTANDLSVIYGSLVPAYTATVTGLLDGESLPDIYTVGSPYVLGSSVGTYPITPVGDAVSGNYAVSYVSGELTVGKRDLSGTLSVSGRCVYDGSEKAVAFSVSDVVSSVELVSVSDYSVSGNTAVVTGIYEVTVTATESGNYFGTASAVWSVEKAPSSAVAPVAVNLTYDSESHVLAVPGSTSDGVLRYSLSPNDAFGSDVPSATDAGIYRVFYYVKGDSNHMDSPVSSVEVTVGRAAVTVTADDSGKVFGDIDPVLTCTVSGLKGADTRDVLGTLTVTRDAGSTVGDYAINVFGTAATVNYEITYVAGTFTITPKPVSVPSADQTAYTYTGSAITYGIVSTSDYVVRGGVQTNAGNHTVTVSLPDQKNYVWSTSGTTDDVTYPFVIGKVPAAVTANSLEKVYGDVSPRLTYTVTGLKGADTDDVLKIIIVRVTGEDVGTYPVSVYGETSTVNYDVTYTSGSFTILPRDTAVTVTGHQGSFVYDGYEHTVDGYELSSTSVLFDASKVVCEGVSTVSERHAGTHPIGLAAEMFSYTDPNLNVRFTVVDGQLRIAKATNNASLSISGWTYGDAPSVPMYSVGFGTPVLRYAGTTFAGETYDSFEVPSQSGEYTLSLVVAATSDYDGCNSSAAFTISKLRIAVPSAVTGLVYNGDLQTGVVGGIFYSVSCGDAVNAGSYFATVALTDTDNCEWASSFSGVIPYTISKLNVAAVVTGHRGTVTYDGTEHEVNGYDVSFSSPLYSEEFVTFIGPDGVKRTTVGTSTMGLMDAYFNNTGANFTVSFSVTDGSLTITPAHVAVNISGTNEVVSYRGVEVVSPSVFTATSESPLFDPLRVTSTASPARGTVVGTYVTGLEESMFGYDDGNLLVTFIVTDGSLTIEATLMTVSVIGNIAVFTFDGTEHAVQGYTLSGDSPAFDPSKVSYTGVTSVRGTDVGEYPLYLASDGFAYDDANVCARFVTSPGLLVIEALRVNVTVEGNRLGVGYDGESHTVQGYDVSCGSVLFDPAFVTFTGTASVSGSVIGVHSMGLDASMFGYVDRNLEVNYIVTDGFLAVDTATMVILVTGGTTSVAYDGEEKFVSGYTLSSDNGVFNPSRVTFSGVSIVSGISVGTYAMGLDSVDFRYNDPYVDAVFVISDGVLEITPLDVTVIVRGNVGSFDYDGTSATVSGYVAVCDSEFYDESKVGFTGTSSVSAVTAGTHPMGLTSDLFTYDDTNLKVTFHVIDGYLEVIPVDVVVEVTGTSSVRTYNGEVQTVDNTYSLSCDVSAYAFSKVIYTGSATTSGTVIGVYPMGLSVDQFVNTDPNYNVTFQVSDGALVISSARFVVAADGYNAVYDGLPHSPSVRATTVDRSGVTVTYSLDGVVFSSDVPVFTDYGGYVVYYRVTAENYEDTTGFVPVVITKRVVTVTSGSVSRTYDGTPLTCESVIVTGDGFVNGEEPVYTYRASITDVGNVSNAFTCSRSDDPNYRIELRFGTLTVTPATLIVTPVPVSVVYDGSHHSVTQVDCVGLAEGQTVEVSLWSAGNTLVDVGRVDVYAKSVSVFSNRVDVSHNYSFDLGNPGYLEVTPRGVSDAVVVLGDSHLYDGEVQKQFVTEVIVDGLHVTFNIEGDEATDVGTHEMVITAYGNFTGSRIVEWRIAPARVTFSIAVPVGQSYDGTAHETSANAVGLIGSDAVSVTLTYSDNVNAGVCNVAVGSFELISGSSVNYIFDVSATVDFIIAKANMTSVEISEISAEVFDGTAHTPVPSVSVTSPMVISGSDYSMTYRDNVNAGTARVVITAAPDSNYTGTVTREFEILRSRMTVSAVGYSGVYDGQVHDAVDRVDVRVGSGPRTGYSLFYSSDGVSWSDEMPRVNGVSDSGIVRIKVEWANYEDAFTQVDVGIVPKTVGVIVDDVGGVEFDGSPHTVPYRVEGVIGDDVIEAVLAYSDNINAGRCQVTVSSATVTRGDASNYAVDISDSALLEISRKALTPRMVSVSGDYVYDGTVQAVAYSVSDGGILTVADYDVTGASAIGAGTHVLTIIAKGNYTGMVTREWTIGKAVYDTSSVHFDDATVRYNGKVRNLAVTGVVPFGLSVRYVSDTAVDVGSYPVTAVFFGDYENFEPVTDMQAVLTIEPYDISDVLVILENTGFDYTGSPIRPRVESVTALDGVGPVAYYVSYGSNTEPGTGYVTLTGHGNYAGTVVASFVINAFNMAPYEVIHISTAGHVLGTEHGYLVIGSQFTPEVRSYANYTSSEPVTVTIVDGMNSVTCTYAAEDLVISDDTIHGRLSGSDISDAVNMGAGITLTYPIGSITLSSTTVRDVFGAHSGDYSHVFRVATSSDLTPAQQDAVGSNRVITVRFLDNGDNSVSDMMGPVIVRLAYVPAVNEDTDRTTVYFVDLDGSTTPVETWFEGDEICFRTTHFSEYMIVPGVEPAPTGVVFILLVSILIASVIIVCCASLHYRRRRVAVSPSKVRKE